MTVSQSTQVLVVNVGSSSLKYDVWAAREVAAPFRRVVTGLVERIGESGGRHIQEAKGAESVVTEEDVADHRHAVALMLDAQRSELPNLLAVGHRVVHGGARYQAPTVIDDVVEAGIDELSVLAPLHNPPGLVGIRALRAAYPHIPQVAVFDTAFHATLAPEARTYAIPPDLARQHGIRRWGFHGTSHQYVTRAAAEFLGVPVAEVGLVICHIGNGVSLTAVRGGCSIDTSQGMTPLEGLVMGTRSGDLDPAVVLHLQRQAGMSPEDVDSLLTAHSGLRGLCGDSDVRSVRARAQDGDAAAQLALDVYAHRLRKYVGAYLAQVPDLHAVVFTAGVGENDPMLRRSVIEPLAHLGLRLDDTANTSAVGPADPVRIDDGTGRAAVLVIPTDESAEICRSTVAVLTGSG
jgi:acetate kinase